MAHALTDKPAGTNRFSETVNAVLGSKALIPSLAALASGVLLFLLYAAYDYLNAECYVGMRKAGLVAETSALFEDVGATLTRLRKGTAAMPKWNDPDFQDSVKAAQAILADGRRALKEQEPLKALDAVVDVQKKIARAKALATDRVNFILSRQDPADYDGFEKYRLEGKNLVAIVGELDSALETLDSRSRKLPDACQW